MFLFISSQVPIKMLIFKVSNDISVLNSVCVRIFNAKKAVLDLCFLRLKNHKISSAIDPSLVGTNVRMTSNRRSDCYGSGTVRGLHPASPKLLSDTLMYLINSTII